jgi:hypothetical protein
MDQFGIGSAIKGCAINFFAASRQSGRTTQLIESLKNGDRVVCISSKDAEWLRRRIKEFDKDIDVISIPTKDAGKIFDHATSKGRTIFDHRWLEQFYIEAIDRLEKEIDYLQRESSGFGAAHIETKMMFANRLKFQC